jgi:protein TonB
MEVGINFIVEKDGSITNINILKGTSNDLINESIQIVKDMPKWTPGKQNGILVRTRCSLIFRFN